MTYAVSMIGVFPSLGPAPRAVGVLELDHPPGQLGVPVVPAEVFQPARQPDPLEAEQVVADDELRIRHGLHDVDGVVAVLEERQAGGEEVVVRLSPGGAAA